MINYFWIAFLGIVIWQIICTIIYYVSKQDDKVTMGAALFVPIVILSFINIVSFNIWFSWCKKHLNSYMLHCPTNGKDVGYIVIQMTDKWANKMYRKGENGYYIEKITDGSMFKSAPNNADIYKGQARFKGFDMENFFWRE